MCCNKVQTFHAEKLKSKETFAELKVSLCKDEAVKNPRNMCGFRNAKGISGDVRSMQNKTLYAQYAEFPWMMAIFYQTSEGQFYKGGGSLVHPKVVLTSPHKISGLDPKRIRC